MRDKQVIKALNAWPGFNRGLISMTDAPRWVSLSDILEPEVSAKYSLSAKACLGILRRSEKRGRSLPPLLQLALEHAARTTTRDKLDT